jgi:hypothetical protein
VTASLAAVLALIAGAGYNVYSRDGLEWRLKGSELQRVKFNTTLQYHRQCRRDFEFARDSFCLRGNDHAPPTVALIGDSHAVTLYPGLGQYYAERGENLVNFGIGGGIPFYGVERYVRGRVTQGYSTVYAPALDYVTRDPNIKTILLMAKAVSYGSNDDGLRYVPEPELTDSIEVFGKAMAETLRRLQPSGKQIVFILDNPMVDFDPASCFQRPHSAPPRAPCAVSRALYEKRSRAYRQKVEEVLARFPGVKRWDPMRYLCDKELCWAIKDGKVLFGRDGQHLTLAGSHWLASRFAPE